MIKHLGSGRTLAHNVEHMKSASQRSVGLLKYPDALNSFAGVFRLPFKGFFPMVHTFGMNFSIDIIFCDRAKKILHSYSQVKPNRVVCPLNNFFGGCQYLVEFSRCNLDGVKIGDVLGWEDQ
jgi:uncharacterized membrane protein (UPF0127 family)